MKPCATDERILGLLRDHPDVGFTARDIADLCGTTPHTVHTTISRLRAMGLLHIECVRVYKTPEFKSGLEVVQARECL